jgi:hypothetical protein
VSIIEAAVGQAGDDAEVPRRGLGESGRDHRCGFGRDKGWGFGMLGAVRRGVECANL